MIKSAKELGQVSQRALGVDVTTSAQHVMTPAQAQESFDVCSATGRKQLLPQDPSNA